MKQQSDFKSERKKFITECLLGLEELTKSKKKLNKTQLAEILFRDLNPLQSFRRKLNNFGLSFDDILQQYSEQKSS